MSPDFNPRTPRGVRPQARSTTGRISEFQSTHPARGATLDDVDHQIFLWSFQSTHPARGATAMFPCHFNYRKISIHAPREGCDCARCLKGEYDKHFNPRTPRGVRPATSACCACAYYFNPRTPRGVRRCSVYILPPFHRFQSTHPARGATPVPIKLFWLQHISIHAPREGCDF